MNDQKKPEAPQHEPTPQELFALLTQMRDSLAIIAAYLNNGVSK